MYPSPAQSFAKQIPTNSTCQCDLGPIFPVNSLTAGYQPNIHLTRKQDASIELSTPVQITTELKIKRPTHLPRGLLVFQCLGTSQL
jgi:hypothetical protein